MTTEQLSAASILSNLAASGADVGSFDHSSKGRLGRILAHFDRDLGLSAPGKAAARRCIVDLASIRASIHSDRARHPDIQKEQIVRPIIITGLPRSGTTVMQYLLAADPSHRSPTYWEAAYPSPPPGICSAGEKAQRDCIATSEIDAFLERSPLTLKMHPYFDEGGSTLAECELLGAADFRNLYVTRYFRVPAVPQLSLMDEPKGFFDFHKAVLQHLQYGQTAARWVLKGTEHHAYLGDLLEVYPDAIVVWLHRDPYKVVPSLMTIYYNWFSGMSGQALDKATFGRQILAAYEAMLNAAVADDHWRRSNVNHVRFADFMADPVGSIGAIYERNGLLFSQDSQTSIRSWLDDPKNDPSRHGRIQYDLSEFDMTRREVDAKFERYRDTFAIPQEGVSDSSDLAAHLVKQASSERST